MGTRCPASPSTVPARVEVNVFVSYTGTNEAGAAWVTAVLEVEGQTVRVGVRRRFRQD